MAWKHWASDARRELPKLVTADAFRRRVGSQVHCRLRKGSDFWPALADAIKKVGGDAGAILVGPGMFASLKAAGAADRGSIVQCVEDLPDREVYVVGAHPHPADFLREFPSNKLARVVVMTKEGGQRKKRGMRQPRFDLVPPSAQPYGLDWRVWMRQFPVVGRVKGRSLRCASDDGIRLSLNVGAPVPIVPGG